MGTFELFGCAGDSPDWLPMDALDSARKRFSLCDAIIIRKHKTLIRILNKAKA